MFIIIVLLKRRWDSSGIISLSSPFSAPRSSKSIPTLTSSLLDSGQGMAFLPTSPRAHSLACELEMGKLLPHRIVVRINQDTVKHLFCSVHGKFLLFAGPS